MCERVIWGCCLTMKKNPGSNQRPLHCVHEKMPPPEHVQKSSKLASFMQFQFNSMNICVFSIKLPILVKIRPTVIEILAFNKWSSIVYHFQKRVTSITSLSDSWRSGRDLTTRSPVLQLLSGELVCVRV